LGTRGGGQAVCRPFFAGEFGVLSPFLRRIPSCAFSVKSGERRRLWGVLSFFRHPKYLGSFAAAWYTMFVGSELGELRRLPTMAIVEVTDQNFSDEVKSGTVLVDFWAPWCGPCKMIAPVLEELDSEIGDQLKIAKLNVDNNPETAGRFGVMSIPTLMVFKDGEMVSKMVGFQPKEQLREWLDSYL
jgi:thioredoxin 1